MPGSRLAVIATVTAVSVIATACIDSSRESPTSPTNAAAARALNTITAAVLGGPLVGLTGEQLAAFNRGAIVASDSFGVPQGIGPLFNGFYCTDCHANPVAGGIGDDVERHATAYRRGVCDPLTSEGGFVIQNQVTPAITALFGLTSVPLPPDRTGVGLRTTGQLFGRGLLEAVPDEELIELARRERSDPDDIAGTPSILAGGHVGRFGRKGNSATLTDFVGGAFINEMGITNPLHPHEYGFIGTHPIPASLLSHGLEISQQQLDDATAFVRYLAPPAPQQPTQQTMAGAQAFRRIGCASCHVPTLTTGWNPVRALRSVRVAAFSDLLLHDMGPRLADICLNGATPSQFRTEPLMGVSLRSQFLHDGRAKTVEQAILLHGGQANPARRRFSDLSPIQRAALVAYVNSL